MMQVIHYIIRQKTTQDAFASSLYQALRPGGDFVVLQYNCRTSQFSEADSIFSKAGFEIGRKFEVWNHRGQKSYGVMEYRRPEISK